MSNINRRTFATALIATPVAALPVIGGETDPIYAAVAAFERADEAWLAAQRYIDAIASAQPWDVVRPGRVQVGTQASVLQEDPEYGVEKPIYATSEDEVMRWTRGRPERRRAQLLAELAADITRQEARQCACGLFEAEELADTAFEDRDAAESAAYTTIPTTPAGAVYWAKFVLRMIRAGVRDGDEAVILESVVAYLQNCHPHG